MISQEDFGSDPFTALDNTHTAAKQDPFDPFGNGKHADKIPATSVREKKIFAL